MGISTGLIDFYLNLLHHRALVVVNVPLPVVIARFGISVIPHVRTRRKGFKIQKRHFKYDSEDNVYICSCQRRLRYRTTNRTGLREYVSNADICGACKMLSESAEASNKDRVITRHVWQKHKDQIRENILTPLGKYLRQKRRETVERSFADAKPRLLAGFALCQMPRVEEGYRTMPDDRHRHQH